MWPTRVSNFCPCVYVGVVLVVSREGTVMARADEKWFEDREIDGRRCRHVSKFYRTEFAVSLDFVKARWRSWSRKDRGLFAAAFAARHKLLGADRDLLDFLIDNGDDEVWNLIGQLLAREHPDRARVLKFLLSRVMESASPLANYYQALGILSAMDGVGSLRECISYLKHALIKHRQEAERHPAVRWWKLGRDRFIYMDYLSCSATLFKLTGVEEYRANLKAMLEHRDESVRMLVRTVAISSGIAV